ncbi:MAG: hypothetical protein HYY02_06860 [Chloroflexi bacterium]|nr:hypothetical protein [Chloroflexota bacterium]
MVKARQVVGVLVWVILLGGIFPAARLSDFISQRTEGLLAILLFVGLVIGYLALVSALILLMDTAVRRLAARFGWQYEDPQE